MGAPAEKHRLSVRTAASGPPRPNRVSGVDAHNAALRAAQARVDELEGKLADLLVPILEAAGRKAASNFRARAPVGMVAALTAAGPGVASNSTMVALKPRPAEAEALGLSTSIPTETLHVTLAYLGEIDGPLEPIAAALAAVAANHAPIVGEVAGGGFFGHPDGGGPTILLPDVPGLVELRVDVSEALTVAEIPYSRDHGFQAHVTVAYRGDPEGEFPPEVDYRPSDDPTIRCGTCLRFDGARGVCVMFDAPAEPEMVCDEWTDEPYDPIGEPLHFDSILIVRGDTEIVEIPLVGVPPLTAASPPPGWIPPAGDEIVDVDALVKTLRTKTDPVRRALLEASMTPGLGAAGLDFDVTNPFTAKVLSRAGQNVRSIALTTQLNVMRSVKSAYSNGLSVPDTASLIQAGMSAAAPARATMIARTELAGAVNGGSLAATQIVSDATGDVYVKRWLTAPGAPNPRHELYEGLDGQEQPLDGLFDVGGSPLMFPGDPDGDPGETINCFPAETLVSMPKLRAATRRWYEGDLVRIRTSAGDDLAATPNHPVLRADGKWVPLGDLCEGDQLVRAEILRSYEGAPDPGDPPASIGEIYRLSEMARSPERVRLTPPDLHGDGAEGEIDVIPVHGNLLTDDKVATDEEITELGLALAYGARSGSSGRDHPARGDFRGSHVSGALASARVVSVDRESATLVHVQTSHTETVRLRASAGGKTEVIEPSENRRAPDVESLRDSEDGLAVLVSLADLVEVEVEPFHGYVYTLDTGDGWFTAGSILVRNCRCTLVYNSPEGVGEASAEDSPPDFGTVDGGSLAVDTPPAGDTVSVATGPFVPATMVSRIDELGLNRPLSDLTPTTTIGRSVFSTAPDTEALYKVAGEWTPDRRALHEDIIAKHFAGKVATGGKPSAFFTAGGGASGKSHALFNVDGADVGLKELGDRADVVWVDPDRIKAMLPEYEKLRDAGDLYAASGVHEESSALAKEITAEAQRRGLSMIVDTTGSSHAFVQKLQAAADAGYEVKATMFSIPTNEAIVRSMARGDRSGRYVAIQALKAAHAGSAQQLAIWKDAGFVKEWRVYDNSGSSPKLVASGGGGTFKVYDEPAWDSILAKSSEATGSSSTVAATTKVPLAKPTPYKTVVADLGKEPSPIQGEEQIATGLDPAVARSLWYLPDIGPRANELVRLGVNPSTIPVDAAKATTVSQTFRDAIAAGRSKIKTWADVIRIAERDAAPLRHDALLLRGMTVREVPKVGDVLSDAQGMVSLTSDAGTADAFALRAPPPAAAGRMGANPAEEEAIAAMLDKGGPRQFLAPGEKAIRLEVETPAGTRLWNPGGDLDEFVVPKGSEFRVTEVRAATRADNFEPYADSPPDVDYIVRGRLEPIAEKPSVATLVPGNPETVDFVTQERAAKFAKFATRWQVDAAGYQEKLDEQVRNAVAGAEIRVRVGHEALERIIGDGRFKSQFESNSSGGLLSPKYRAAVENQMFGYSEDLDPTLRPIYGYLSGSLGSTDLVDETYGSVMVRLKQAAADRATFTLSDSLGAGERRELVPQPLSNPNALALPIENFSSDPLRAIQPSLERISSSYAEAQIHGGLTLDDVAEVVLNRRALSQEAIQARAEISYLEGWISDAEELAKENPSPNDSFQREIEARRAQIAVYQAELARVENEGAALKAALEKAGIPYRVVPDGKTLEELPAG